MLREAPQLWACARARYEGGSARGRVRHPRTHVKVRILGREKGGSGERNPIYASPSAAAGAAGCAPLVGMCACQLSWWPRAGSCAPPMFSPSATPPPALPTRVCALTPPPCTTRWRGGARCTRTGDVAHALPQYGAFCGAAAVSGCVAASWAPASAGYRRGTGRRAAGGGGSGGERRGCSCGRWCGGGRGSSCNG